MADTRGRVIVRATRANFPVIAAIWERSVRATHHFLPEDYLLHIKSLLPSILPAVQVWMMKDEKGKPVGFAGVDGEKLEMLFLEPESIGTGAGSAFTRFCVEELGVNTVDVNEHNEQATRFYRHMGFVPVSRSETDSLGKPFPILHMELSVKKNK